MWREYHEATKHTAESLRRSQHFLEWANMPHPFRHYESAPLIDLPADPPAPESAEPVADGAEFLSRLLFYSAAISATKEVPSTGYRYALRVNPSSGNLHPTEFHFVTRGLKGWTDGLYHYRPSSHMVEQRARGDFRLPVGDAPLTFVLTSIAWREAWKYRDRAYRYCCHDIGHAWQSLELAARAMDCEVFARGGFADDELALALRLNADEWPMLIVTVAGGRMPLDAAHAGTVEWSAGEANELSAHVVEYPWIEKIHAATKLAVWPPTAEPSPVDHPDRIPNFGEVVRSRRSALDFRGGDETISLTTLSSILEAAILPLAADFGESAFIELYVYVHRVEGLDAGVYRYADRRLHWLRTGDQRTAAAGLSLGQNLAGNSCITFSMIADIDRATALFGERGYRYVYFEAGAIGQRLYLAAEANGLGATGIGAFFDDKVHEYLGLLSGQAVYHFAIGYPVPDPRLVALL